MRNIVFLLIAIPVFISCEKNDILGTTVKLIPTDDPIIFNKSVILYDQDDFLIKTPLDTFIIGYPLNMHGYEDLKTQAIQDGIERDLLIVSDYLIRNSDSLFSLAYYMERGSCYLFDKSENKSIKSIQVETYMEGEPMQSTGGRRFYIKNELFLETIDMISK